MAGLLFEPTCFRLIPWGRALCLNTYFTPPYAQSMKALPIDSTEAIRLKKQPRGSLERSVLQQAHGQEKHYKGGFNAADTGCHQLETLLLHSLTGSGTLGAAALSPQPVWDHDSAGFKAHVDQMSKTVGRRP